MAIEGETPNGRFPCCAAIKLFLIRVHGVEHKIRSTPGQFVAQSEALIDEQPFISNSLITD